MTTYLVFALLLLVSTLYAVILQVTSFGRWLARERTWLSVVIGVGYTVLALVLVIPRSAWFMVVMAFLVASLPIIGRSLWNELRRDSAVWKEVRGDEA